MILWGHYGTDVLFWSQKAGTVQKCFLKQSSGKTIKSLVFTPRQSALNRPRQEIITFAGVSSP